MSDRTKIISQFKNKSYKNFFPKIPFAIEENYFLQFNSYTIYLPEIAPKVGKLNILELGILKLLSIAPFTLEELAEKICLEVDLAKIICDRLFELELINKYREITNAGKIFLGLDANFHKSKNILPYSILTACDTGEIFPKIFPRNYIKVVNKKVTRTNAAEILGRATIFVPQKSSAAETISQKILRELVEEFNKIHKQKIFVEPDFFIPSTYSSPVFLHIKIVLKNNRDNFFLVSCGDEFDNEFLKSYFERQKKYWR